MTNAPNPLAGIHLRPEGPGDRAFLLALYATTREAELAQTDWNADQKAAFVEMQFQAQHAYYREVYVGAAFDVLERGGAPIGRLYTDRDATFLRVIDITLVPAARGAGVGGALLRRLLDEGRATQRAVTIHVERFNPALRLYLRLGFQAVEDKGLYLRLEAPARPHEF